MMFLVLTELLDSLSDRLDVELAGIDPGVLSGGDAGRVLRCAARLKKQAEALELLVARRVTESRIWAEEGHQSAAHFLARESGESLGRAKDLFDTASEVAGLPSIEEAVRRGGLSTAQASEIAGAVKADPSAEQKLIDAAGAGSFGELKDLCSKVRSAASDQMRRYREIHAKRSLRRWTSSDGAFHIHGILTPDSGARIWNRIEDETRLLSREARRAGSGDRLEALQADALVALVAGDGQSSPAAQMILNVDAQALHRGYVNPGETCEIRGAGSIPVDIARELLPEAFGATVVKSGIEIKTITHHDVHIAKTLRIAVLARDRGCVVPGCDNCRYLEIDHIIEFALGGPTELDNLATLCTWHHRRKTIHKWQIKRNGNQWLWIPPPHTT